MADSILDRSDIAELTVCAARETVFFSRVDGRLCQWIELDMKWDGWRAGLTVEIAARGKTEQKEVALFGRDTLTVRCPAPVLWPGGPDAGARLRVRHGKRARRGHHHHRHAPALDGLPAQRPLRGRHLGLRGPGRPRPGRLPDHARGAERGRGQPLQLRLRLPGRALLAPGQRARAAALRRGAPLRAPLHDAHPEPTPLRRLRPGRLPAPAGAVSPPLGPRRRHAGGRLARRLPHGGADVDQRPGQPARLRRLPVLRQEHARVRQRTRRGCRRSRSCRA